MTMTLDRRTIVLALTVLLLAVGVAGGILLGGDDAEDPADSGAQVLDRPSTTAAPPPTCPLTGTRASDAAALERPALVVKIDNVEPKARPQVGIRQADVVYEERVEGSVTRFMAVYQCTDASPIGPVRSARSSDIPLFSQLNRPLFAWSGANDIFARMVRDANIVDVGHDAASDQYYRERSRPAPHNLFIQGYTRMLAAHAPDGSKPPPALFTFRKANEEVGGEPAKGVHIVFGTTAGNAPVDWMWNGKAWTRSQSGRPHVDGASRQIEAQNVIVQFVDYKPSQARDQQGNPVPEASLVGEGDAWILTGGHLIQGRWKKAAVDAVTQYTSRLGRPINLTPGRTWVALPPGGSASIVR
jgi:hypothetical protein